MRTFIHWGDGFFLQMDTTCKAIVSIDDVGNAYAQFIERDWGEVTDEQAQANNTTLSEQKSVGVFGIYQTKSGKPFKLTLIADEPHDPDVRVTLIR